MERLGTYILSITTAAILLGILQSLLEKKSSSAALLRLIGGLFLAFTVLAPVADIDLDSTFQAPWDFTTQGQVHSEQGLELTQSQLQDIIKRQCEAYILDKAISYQAPLSVEVTLSQDDLPVPAAVHLRGNVSPYVKGILQKWLNDEMGIPKENQIWNA